MSDFHITNGNLTDLIRRTSTLEIQHISDDNWKSKVLEIHRSRLSDNYVQIVETAPMEWLKYLTPNLLEYGVQHETITKMVDLFVEVTKDERESDRIELTYRMHYGDGLYPSDGRIGVARDAFMESQRQINDEASELYAGIFATFRFMNHNQELEGLKTILCDALLGVMGYDLIQDEKLAFKPNHYDDLTLNWKRFMGTIDLEMKVFSS